MPPEAPVTSTRLPESPVSTADTQCQVTARISTRREATSGTGRAAARPTGIGRTTEGRAVARTARGLLPAPLGQALPLVQAGVRAEQDRQRPDQQKEDDDDDLHTLSMACFSISTSRVIIRVDHAL